MKLTFIGAAHEVTGSCYLLEACGKNILIDCGMEQGRNIFENQEIPVIPAEIDLLLLTHAHIDHSGKIPLLFSHGFRGSVLATPATCSLCDIMLRDSGHIQEFEAEWRSRKAKRAGTDPYIPLYTVADAIESMKLFLPCEYGEAVEPSDGISVRFYDAGHLLGSASIEITLREKGEKRVLVFSGDIGNSDKPILRDPTLLKTADYVVMESTYGDRLHGPKPDYTGQLTDVIRRTFARGGNVVIPAFAVGRTQELLYFLRQIKSENRLPEFPHFPVVIDSPLAIEATEIFGRDGLPCYDAQTAALVEQGINPISFEGLTVSLTSEESKQINSDKTPKVILSASGMCEAGRIRHHLKHNLWREECTVLFAGYQSEGTIGRILLDGADHIRLFGETIEVRAEIARMDSISSHADREGLRQWVKAFDPAPQRIFVTHGDEAACEQFAAVLREEEKLPAMAPYSGDAWDLISDCQTEAGSRQRIQKRAVKPAVSPVFARLLAAGQRLNTVIEHNQGGANKDLAKLADQINALCDKWDR